MRQPNARRIYEIASDKGRASHGSGLGLTIARNLVVAHGGEIAATSEVGQGTTITFTLPLS